MVSDIVTAVAGDRGVVTGLIKGDRDPHMFTTGNNDVKNMFAADAVFYTGLMLEGRMADDFASVGKKGDLRWLEEQLSKTCSLKSEYLGPGRGETREVQYLGRGIA